MPIKFFACSCRGDDEASAALNQLLNGHKIVAVEKNFVQDGQTSFWALCVTYMEQSAEARSSPMKRGKVGRSRDGAMFCGLRVLPGALRLSRRRRKRYADRRDFWERAYCRGEIDECALQMGYGAALAITVHASSTGWRREQLRRRPIAGPLQAI